MCDFRWGCRSGLLLRFFSFCAFLLQLRQAVQRMYILGEILVVSLFRVLFEWELWPFIDFSSWWTCSRVFLFAFRILTENFSAF